MRANTVDFDGIDIRWDRRVLEPRPWTAAQAHWVAELARDAPEGPILELCCGAGQIGLLAARLSRRSLVQVDSDEVAGAYARENAKRAGIPSDVRIEQLDRALGASERFPLIVVDPPWLPTALVAGFPDDPVTAVDGGPDGLTVVGPAVEVAIDHLAPSGHIVFQVGTDAQADYLEAALVQHAAGEPSSAPVLVARRRFARGVLVHIADVPRGH